jgi:hypothetical protein
VRPGSLPLRPATDTRKTKVPECGTE